MSARAFATNVSIILGVMAIGALLESIVPMFAAAVPATVVAERTWR
jgi:hypothetical protein